jgi:hypothetical protein
MAGNRELFDAYPGAVTTGHGRRLDEVMGRFR